MVAKVMHVVLIVIALFVDILGIVGGVIYEEWWLVVAFASGLIILLVGLAVVYTDHQSSKTFREVDVE